MRERRGNGSQLLERLIAYIRQDRRGVKRPKLLISTLDELNSITGHKKLKDQIASHIYADIKMRKRGKKRDCMCSVVIYGPPGAGKTHIGKIIAKVCHALGIIEKKEAPKTGIASVLPSESWMSNEQNLSILFTVVIIGYSILTPIIVWVYNKAGAMNMVLGILILLSIGLILLAVYYYYTTVFGANSGNNNGNNNKYNPKNNKGSKGNNDQGVIGGDDDYKRVRGRRRKQDVDDDDDFLDNLYGEEDEEEEEEFDINDIFVEDVQRADLTGKYSGWSEDKALEFMNKNRGKMIFFDEFYNMIAGENDSFGEIVLGVINRYLTEHKGESGAIFCGYKKQMREGPFRIQPGLERRCLWKFEFDGYDGQELAEIFLIQIKKEGWRLDDVEAICKIIEDNADDFPFYGGDTERLVQYAIDAHGEEDLMCMSRGSLYRGKPPEDMVLSVHHVVEGLKILRDQSTNGCQDDDESSGCGSKTSGNPDINALLRELNRAQARG